MKHLILLSFLAIYGLTACSSGNGGPAKTPFCGSKWRPLKLDIDKAEKTDLSTAEPHMPAGTYTANETTLYYWDKKEDIKMQFTAKKNEEGKTNVVVDCVGGEGFKYEMESMAFAIPFVSNMSVEANGKSILTTQTIAVEIGRIPGKPFLRAHSDSVGDPAQGSIKNTYDGYPVTANYLFNVQNSYETRVQLRSDVPAKEQDDALDVRIHVNYGRAKPTPTEQ